ncbi:MAG: hypothetical protein ABIQ95_02770 [Bdellovibrionia bacterium]
MKTQIIASIATLFGLIVITPAIAASSNKNAGELISVSGGIAMPSFSTSINSNPAGIVGVPGTNLIIQDGTNSQFSNHRLAAGLAYGNGSVGLEAGVGYANPSGDITGFFGLGFGIPSIKTQIGFSGFMGLSPSSGVGINGGLLIAPSDKMSFGVTAIGLNSGVNEWGAGVGFNISPNVGIAVDAAFSNNFNFLTVEPGLKVGTDQASLMLAYGSGSGSSQLVNNDIALGGAVKLGSRVHWELYYNKFSTFFTSFAIQL